MGKKKVLKDKMKVCSRKILGKQLIQDQEKQLWKHKLFASSHVIKIRVPKM